MRTDTAGAARSPRRSRIRGRLAAAVTGGALLLTGCASMPGSGEVQRVDSGQRADGDSQVRVFGVSPQEGALPQQIVRGFLEAVTSDEADFRTAREYLTPERREDWDPFAGTTVLSAGPDFGTMVSEPEPDGADRFSIELSGTRLAFVDGLRVYAPDEGPYRESFQLTQVDGEWRIGTLPDGLVLGEADFRRIYRSVNTFYYADLGPESQSVEGAGNVLVADPVYVRRRIDPVGETVAALLTGPSEWLAPVARTAFPADARPAGDRRAAVDDSGVLTVPLAGVSAKEPRSRCERMAAQLLHTVQGLAPTELREVRLTGPDGKQLCAQTASQAQDRAPGLLAGNASRQYFLDDNHALVYVLENEQRPHRAAGALGNRETQLRRAAVSRDETLAAGVSRDGSGLYVAPLSGDEPLEPPVYASATAGEEGGLSAPSWDGLGDLWIADRAPDGPGLLRLAGGSGTPREIPVRGLRGDQRIEALRVASDGVRIALLVSDDGTTTLQLGRIERTGTVESGEVAVEGLRPVAPHLENVVAASWAGDSRLVVVGRPADGVEQLQYVATDGSSSTTAGVPGLNDVTGVAAAEDESRLLLAETANGIARLQPDANWKRVTEDGYAPVYPG
ncbi:LpqB family beta-propeller domain-containing protein [Streptomyces sodiiphilus]|uniref:LpqB family beta-propeller domain-containing protein n=1 Tax=Streptomyces sodiiphilus TaxID=226217 RepID=A0ABN2PUC8_9ACTN